MRMVSNQGRVVVKMSSSFSLYYHHIPTLMRPLQNGWNPPRRPQAVYSLFCRCRPSLALPAHTPRLLHMPSLSHTPSLRQPARPRLLALTRNHEYSPRTIHPRAPYLSLSATRARIHASIALRRPPALHHSCSQLSSSRAHSCSHFQPLRHGRSSPSALAAAPHQHSQPALIRARSRPRSTPHPHARSAASTRALSRIHPRSKLRPPALEAAPPVLPTTGIRGRQTAPALAVIGVRLLFVAAPDPDASPPARTRLYPQPHWRSRSSAVAPTRLASNCAVCRPRSRSVPCPRPHHPMRGAL
ncbi:hypothetical protein FIBSPDRAFT_1038892 [Athelia psychrophila]|uniref:Uncharacterized protein n=1 Tax=Athelia psychrophila TaxID=1759441 RepID=A0A166SLZ8_9AGAM|nr:hypothetical protein FIBSPDRAFT_1038892 [Fibularhizoctonia sp. CBS 109695]